MAKKECGGWAAFGWFAFGFFVAAAIDYGLASAYVAKNCQRGSAEDAGL